MLSYDKELFSRVDPSLARLLLKNFNFRFPEFALQSWVNIDIEKAQKIVDRLMMLGYGKAFTICPTCPVCQAPGEKTGEVPQMPEDF